MAFNFHGKRMAQMECKRIASPEYFIYKIAYPVFHMGNHTDILVYLVDYFCV